MSVCGGGAGTAAACDHGPRAATTPTRTVTTDGMTFGFRAFGRGRPIVFIQGLSGTMDAWDPRFLDAVAAQGRRVVLFDNRGMGRSEPLPSPLTMTQMADDAAALIRALRLRRRAPAPDVFGWSMGGMIAQSLAVRHPRSSRRLVLARPRRATATRPSPTPRGLAVIAELGSASISLDTLFGPRTDAKREAFLANILLRCHPEPVGLRPVIDAQAIASAQWFAGNGGRKITQLRKRVLVGGGALDELLPVANQRHIARRIPRRGLVLPRRSARVLPPEAPRLPAADGPVSQVIVPELICSDLERSVAFCTNASASPLSTRGRRSASHC